MRTRSVATLVVLALPGALGAQVAQFFATSPPALNWLMATNGVLDDFDRDGDADLCATETLSLGPYVLFRNGGLGELVVNPLPSVFMLSGARAAFVDFDGDNHDDLFVSWPGPYGSSVALFRYVVGTTWVDASANLPPMQAFNGAIAGDFDGDGDQDLVLGDEINYANQFDRLLLNNGSGTFVEVPGAIPPHPGIHTSSVAFADVDEDGDLDLIRGGQPPNLCLNDGTGMFTLATNRFPQFGNLHARALVADLDHDGDVGIVLLTSGQPGQILWNRHRHVTVPAPPVIGQNWIVELWGQPGYGVGTRAAVLGLGLARLAQPVAVPPFGALWLDLGVPYVMQPALIAPGAGAVPLVFAIPPAPSIVGVALHVQALIEETAGVGDARLTQLVSATIQ